MGKWQNTMETYFGTEERDETALKNQNADDKDSNETEQQTATVFTDV